MKISEKGIALIKQYEGCKLFAYRDSVGVLTIGYGHTKGVKAGQAITQQQADAFLREDLKAAENTINATDMELTQNQFDALVSWVFNLGASNFYKSTMYKYIKTKRSPIEICDQMVLWHNAGGRPLLGLKRRRVAEANLYMGSEIYYINKDEKIVKR